MHLEFILYMVRAQDPWILDVLGACLVPAVTSFGGSGTSRKCDLSESTYIIENSTLREDYGLLNGDTG